MVISLAKRSASRTISSKALRRISARSRGFFAAQPSKAPCAASIAALASSTLALATEAILFSVAGSITSKRAPSDDLRHLPPIHRSVGTLASRLSYMAMMCLLQLCSERRTVSAIRSTVGSTASSSASAAGSGMCGVVMRTGGPSRS